MVMLYPMQILSQYDPVQPLGGCLMHEHSTQHIGDKDDKFIMNKAPDVFAWL